MDGAHATEGQRAELGPSRLPGLVGPHAGDGSLERRRSPGIRAEVVTSQVTPQLDERPLKARDCEWLGGLWKEDPAGPSPPPHTPILRVRPLPPPRLPSR